mmetsp:Transcript_6832/g.12687  ORF Transcript_6832/g.12687 Transcript_6832/m.12687 type:complete len:370 (-) Transcript_6832:266-1375(-)
MASLETAVDSGNDDFVDSNNDKIVSGEKKKVEMGTKKNNKKAKKDDGDATAAPVVSGGDGTVSGSIVRTEEEKMELMSAMKLKMEARFARRYDLQNGPVFSAVRAGDAAALLTALAASPGDVERELGVGVGGRTNGSMPLHAAVTGGRSIEVVRVLLDHGAPVNAWCGRTTFCVPLHYTAGAGDTQQVQLLLDYGADPTMLYQKTDPPYTSLSSRELALAGKHDQTAALLAEAEANWTPAKARAAKDSAALRGSRRWPLAVQAMLDGLREGGDSKAMVLEFGNGCGGGRFVREGVRFLDAYAMALDLPRPALLQALCDAPGGLEHWGEGDIPIMDPAETAEVLNTSSCGHVVNAGEKGCAAGGAASGRS